MKKTLAFVLILSAVHFSGSEMRAQDKGLMFAYGGASFHMEDLKGFQEYILSTYPVAGKIISSFPPYVSFSVSYFRQVLGILNIGAGYVQTSTGGKSDYTDYSGSLNTNMVANSHRLGAFLSYTVIGGEKISLSLIGRLDANLTRLRVVSAIAAAGVSYSADNKYKSISPNVSTGLELMYKFKTFSVGLDGGYLVDFPAELSNTEGGSRLHNPTNSLKILTTNWTGWRVNLKAIIWI